MVDEENKPESDIDDDVDHIIQEISEEDPSFSSNVSPLTVATSVEKPAPVPTKSSSENLEQCLTLELKGSIQLTLCFVSGDRRIEVICGEDALVCRMADGTEFKIPTGFSPKRAA